MRLGLVLPVHPAAAGTARCSSPGCSDRARVPRYPSDLPVTLLEKAAGLAAILRAATAATGRSRKLLQRRPRAGP